MSRCHICEDTPYHENSTEQKQWFRRIAYGAYIEKNKRYKQYLNNSCQKHWLEIFKTPLKEIKK
jgi:hypothetical protein